MTRQSSLLALRRPGGILFQAALLLLGLGFLAGARAQTSTVGTISGTVRDQNGAAIPKAEVLIQEERTGLSRTVTADDSGFYTAASLPVGRYSVSTSPSGFKKIVDSGLDLHVNENLVVNLTLQIGQVSETVTITGQSEQVETRSGE